MYNVNTAKLNEIFAYYGRIYQNGNLLLQILQKDTQDVPDHELYALAATQCLHLYFEIFTDIANLLIDGFIMRDPGGYEDMVDILEDEEVVSRSTGELLRSLIRYYRLSVKEYLANDEEKTETAFLFIHPHFNQFVDEVKAYLAKELPSA